MTMLVSKSDFYNKSYQQQNYFPYKSFLYQPYISALITFCGLRKGASVLDVGCGQGFFSHLFRQKGMRVCGIDISETGVSTAQDLYGRSGICFAVSDIRTAVLHEQFDCVFVRSCSLYNTDDFRLRTDITDGIFKHVKPGGTFIFMYNSNLSSKPSTTWRYHSIQDLQEHFDKYPNAKLFFINRVTAYILRKHSFRPIVTTLSTLLSKVSRTGGDLVCVIKKTGGKN